MRQIPSVATSFVAKHEGLRLESYQDSGGVWTIGYGHTGPDVHAGQRISEAKARSYLSDDLRTAAARLHGVVKREVIDDLTDNQYAALLSFVFNLGASPRWTIWKLLNACQYDAVPQQLMRFVYVGKVKLRGLVNRRAAEVALWSTDEPGSVDESPPSSVTRMEDTPPAPEPKKPLVQSRTALTGAAQVVTGVSAGAVSVQQMIAPQAQHSDFLAKALGTVAIIIVVCGVVLMAIKWLEKREARR